MEMDANLTESAAIEQIQSYDGSEHDRVSY